LKEGTQAISVFLSKQIKHIHLNTPVKHIEYNEEGSIVTAIKDSKIIKFQSKKIVLAFSPTLYSKISFSLLFLASSLHCVKIFLWALLLKQILFIKMLFGGTKD
jgi:hypothetical protein